MKTYLYQAAFAACLFLAACNESKTTDGEITVIPVGAALDARLFQTSILCGVGDE